MKLLYVTLLLVLMPAVACAAEAVPPDIVLTRIEPRSFGYFAGDVFHREIDVTVADPYRLDKASLPAPGRLNYWLYLRGVTLDEESASGKKRYRIGLDYQNFYVALQPTRLAVPGMTLKFTDGTNSADAEVPPLSVVVAALREIQPEKPEEGPQGYLRPNAVPGFVKTGRMATWFGLSLAGLLLGIGFLAYHNAWWPFRARPSRPFTRAARAIGPRARRSDSPDAYRTSLIDLHRAFDASAGRRVLAEDVPEFLDDHAAFRPLGGEIAKFFASSRQAFFGNDVAGAEHALPFASLADLSTRLGEAERRSQ